MRRAALTLVEVLVVLAIIGLLIALLLPAIQSARESGRRIKCSTNMRQIALALHQYHDVHGVLPAYTCANYSFHVSLLPHLEQEPLFRQFNFGINAMDYQGDLASTRVSVLECPSDGSRGSTADGRFLAPTNYFGNSGSGAQRYGFNGVFAYGEHPLGSIDRLPLAGITDGLSQTAMLAEAATGDRTADLRRCVWDIPGSEPPDQFEAFVAFCRQAPNTAPQFGLSRGRPWFEVSLCVKLYNHVLPPNGPNCMSVPFWKHRISTSSSMHKSIVNVAMADGSVHAVNDDVDVTVWRKLGSRNGTP
ncbi:MAG TPA: DUF1559 domain-containing protein [Pirellulaceae bacterium]|nr:DUF1559 domain-containing protein [Pirellulaceae bacterium]